MKTLKISILAAIAAAIVYSCSIHREEEVQSPPENKLDLTPLKTENNNQGTTSRIEDSIKVLNPASSGPDTGLDPPIPTDPNEGGDPKDVPLPPRR
jgi:hypothetical protein